MRALIEQDHENRDPPPHNPSLSSSPHTLPGPFSTLPPQAAFEKRKKTLKPLDDKAMQRRKRMNRKAQKEHDGPYGPPR